MNKKDFEELLESVKEVGLMEKGETRASREFVVENNFENNATFNQNIQLNNAQAGVYLLTVTDGEMKETKKIVVE